MLTEEEFSRGAGGSAAPDIDERVFRGDYGNDQAREYALRADGYDYGDKQNAADKRLGCEKKRRGWLEGEQQSQQ